MGNFECSEDGYTVQVKSRQIFKSTTGQYIGTTWKDLRFPSAPIGVNPKYASPVGAHLQMVGFQSALALAQWFKADNYPEMIETRIVRHRIHWTYDVKVEGAMTVGMEVHDADFQPIGDSDA